MGSRVSVPRGNLHTHKLESLGYHDLTGESPAGEKELYTNDARQGSTLANELETFGLDGYKDEGAKGMQGWRVDTVLS